MRALSVLVACEFSGAVRDALRRRGHHAWSCDLLPAEPSPFAEYHLRGDALGLLVNGAWDMMIAFPPCTHLASSGARWWATKPAHLQREALDFVRLLMDAPVPHIAIENPVGAISKAVRKPDQIIQPWQHGHAETKKTCLWLKNLPLLRPTVVVEPDYMRNADGTYKLDKKGKRYSRIHWMSGRMPAEERRKERSRTYSGIAEAMAEQWGDYVCSLEGKP